MTVKPFANQRHPEPPEACCPCCGLKKILGTTHKLVAIEPVDGDHGVCAGCGCVSVRDDDTWRAAGFADMMAMSPRQVHVILAAVRWVVQRKAAEVTIH